MFIFFFFLFLAVFIVKVPSDVLGAGRSISGAGSCRSVLGDHELLYDTCKLGSVSIGKGVQNYKFRCSKLEDKIGWCVGSVQILHKIISPVFVEFWEILNLNSGFGTFSERRVDNNGAYQKTLTVPGPFYSVIQEDWSVTPLVGWGTNRWCRTTVRRCGAKGASAYMKVYYY